MDRLRSAQHIQYGATGFDLEMQLVTEQEHFLAHPGVMAKHSIYEPPWSWAEAAATAAALAPLEGP